QRQHVEGDHRGDAHQRGEAELAGEEFAIVHGGHSPFQTFDTHVSARGVPNLESQGKVSPGTRVSPGRYGEDCQHMGNFAIYWSWSGKPTSSRSEEHV